MSTSMTFPVNEKRFNKNFLKSSPNAYILAKGVHAGFVWDDLRDFFAQYLEDNNLREYGLSKQGLCVRRFLVAHNWKKVMVQKDSFNLTYWIHPKLTLKYMKERKKKLLNS